MSTTANETTPGMVKVTARDLRPGDALGGVWEGCTVALVERWDISGPYTVVINYPMLDPETGAPMFEAHTASAGELFERPRRSMGRPAYQQAAREAYALALASWESEAEDSCRGHLHARRCPGASGYVVRHFGCSPEFHEFAAAHPRPTLAAFRAQVRGSWVEAE